MAQCRLPTWEKYMRNLWHLIRSLLSRRMYGCGMAMSALMLCSAVGAAPTPATGAATFADPNGRFSLQVPQEWHAQQPGAPGVAAWQSANPPGNFQVSTQALPAGTTVDNFVALSLPGIKTYFPDATVD